MRWPSRMLVAAGALIVVLWGPGASVARAPSRPIQTAVYLGTGPVTQRDLAEAGAAGASMVRLTLPWGQVAPPDEPTQWTPNDPGDPNYDWTQIDADVGAILAAGFQPIITITGAPRWAQKRPVPTDWNAANEPDAKAYGVFAHAVAARFSGAFAGLPRVRYFQAWNEPNISLYLTPQLVDGKPVAAPLYRAMLNAFAKAVHNVHANNLVVAGGLAPFRDITSSVMAQNEDWGPVAFLRSLLCLSPSLKPTCSTRVDADVWAIHPYTSGGPTHRAVLADDVSLGDLSKVRKLLDAAGRAGHLSVRHPNLWVTEFSWDSNPPDPNGVPIALLTRWVAEAVYRLWLNDVRVVTWLQLRDQPLSEGYYQSGLRFTTGQQKPIARAFRFPFVAYARHSSVFVWGRTPGGRPGRIAVEWAARRWKSAGVVRADGNGIFETTVPLHKTSRMRARLLGKASALSPAFSLTVPQDHFYNPFGQPTLLEPKKPK